MPLTLAEHISVDPNVFQGRPCISGTRIPVDLIYELHENGASAAKIAASYPGVTLGEVYAALSYYHDHRTEIEAMVAEDNAWVEQWKRDNPDRWQRIGSGSAE